MGLKIKSFQEVLKGMVDWVANNSKRLIDFSVGSATRTILEAIATELEEYYFKSYKNFMWSVENAVYDSFGFKRKEATYAFGEVVLTFTQNIPAAMTIPKGTRFTTSRYSEEILYFETERDYVVKESSSYAIIEVKCTKAGRIGNIAANTITLMTNGIGYVSEINNPNRFMTGRDEETLAERKQRFTRYVETRARGTIPALEYGTLEVEDVTGVWVDDSQVGIIKIYAHDAAGNLSDDLKKKISDNLYYYKPAGTPMYIIPIVKKPLDIKMEVTVLPQFATDDFKIMIEDEIRYYLDDFVVSQDFISSDLNAFVRGIDKVAIRNCKITSPIGDVPIDQSQLIRSGQIEVKLSSSLGV
jgi:uncharacterized phage protein gp47/JayE